MSRTLRCAVALALAWCCTVAFAQSPGRAVRPPAAVASAPVSNALPASGEPAPEVTLLALRAQLERIPKSVDNGDDLRELQDRTGAIVDQAQKFVSSRTGALDALNARLGELGPAPAAGSTEDPDITRQRSTLERERNALDADIRLARLLAVDAQQRGNDLLAQRRASFEAELLGRTASPFSASFWRNIERAWASDRAKLSRLAGEVRFGLSTSLRGPERATTIAALLGALAAILLGIRLAEIGLAQIAARHFPEGRLRRSLLALATVLLHVLIVAAAAHWAWQVLLDGGTWSEAARSLATSVVTFVTFLGFVIGLGRGLLSVDRPSWRLPPVSDALAARIAYFPWAAALVIAAIWLPTKVNALVQASLAAVVATHVLTALAVTALATVMLLRLRRIPVAAHGADAAGARGAGESRQPDRGDEPERPVWVGFVMGAVALAVVAVWLLLAFGFVALASFLAGQLVWSGVVAAAAYLLFKLADDLSMALLSSRGSSGQKLRKSFDLAPQTLDQAAVLMSGLARIAIFFFTLTAFLAPLGTGLDELFQRSGKLGTSFKVGEFQLVPGAIFGAASVLVLGLIGLRILKHWLDHSYLPSTTLEPGMRSSLTTLLGYVGGVLVIAFALSALGIGIERIAWVASALSVGIGFGLQAIVQNFISGLILLAERPVKVGDWVVLGTAEGDVRRINVRATEIQLGDRSTLIVPNSEFITKTVRNMTLSNAEGRVLIRLPMPLSTDAARVRDVMLAACAGHAGVLESPAPSVSLEGIEAGTLIFQAIAFVASPRLAGGVRSDLLFAILDALKAAELPLSLPASTLLVSPAAPSSMATPLEGAPAAAPAAPTVGSP